MNNDRILFVFNKAANRGNSSAKLDWLEERIATDRLAARVVVPATAEGLDARVQSAWDEGFRTLVICGGDGTLNRVVTAGLMHPYRYGILPMGSGNDFSKSVGVSDSLEESYQTILNGREKPVDILKYSGDAQGYCINTLGFGLDGWANFFANANTVISGKAAYTYGAIRAILKFSGAAFDYYCDEENETRNLLMMTFCNGRIEGGNFPVAPAADISDGLMDVLTIAPMTTLKLLYQLERFKRGKAEGLPQIKRTKCRKAGFASELPAALHCDGEQRGTQIRNLNVEVLPGKISFICSADECS